MPVISVGDYEPPRPHLCAGCGQKIADRYYLLAVDRQWHVRCLMCCECKTTLDSELTCFARDGNIYCKEDYYRLFAVKRCARCQRGIFANELVMRARDLVYHLHCFTCAWCNTALTQGDYFGLRDNLVYCRAHYELVVHHGGESGAFLASGATPGGPEGALVPHDHQRHYPGIVLLPGQEAQSPVAATSAYSPLPVPPTGTTGVRKGRPRKRKTPEHPLGAGLSHGPLGLSMIDPNDGCSLHLTSMDAVQNPGGMSHGAQQRTKRMRTSFKHHQLRTMKSYFSINQNPDAKDLKQLAQKTGLSKRVLQVWFQNARAKWRRNNLKQPDGPNQPTASQTQPTPSNQAPHPNSPGATSSFSEPSPCPSNLNPDSHHPQPPPQQSSMNSQSGVMGGPIDYEGNQGLTSLTSRHAGEAMSLTSFQELY